MPQLTLTHSAPAGVLLRRLQFAETLPGHTLPGQYIVAELEGYKPTFFALANRPGEPVELLVKQGPGAATALGALHAGRTLTVSDASGPGFGVDLSATNPVVLLVNGSGISAVRALLYELVEGPPRDVHLLYGVLTTQHRSFLADLERWCNRGIAVHTIIGGDAADWDGPTGFVQDFASEEGLLTPATTVVLCGVPPMIEAAKQLCAAAGIPDEQVRLNF